MRYQTDSGLIEISRTAIAALVSNAAMQTYGVVSMATSGLTATLTRDPNRGVIVLADNQQQLTIDVYIVVDYGVNIASVATSLINAVRYHVQKATDLTVKQVNIHVQGLRMPE